MLSGRQTQWWGFIELGYLLFFLLESNLLNVLVFHHLTKNEAEVVVICCAHTQKHQQQR